MENQTSHQLSNELVSFTINHKPNCVVELSVTASSQLVKNAYDKAIKAVARETTIPGFRKGKAPDELIQKNFKPAIEKRWEQTIGEEAFAECNRLSKATPLTQDSRINFKMKSHSMDSGAEMTFQYESEPQVPEIDLSKISLENVAKEEVSAEKVEDILNRIRLFFCKWDDVTSRAAEAGDFAFVDLDLIEDDKESRVFTNTRLEIKDPTMAKWMRDLVIGMEIGETKEGFSEVDADASDEDKENFKPKKVKIRLNGIQSATLPPVDDELAKKVGAESAEIMKARLKVLIGKQLEEAQRNEYREQMSHLLLEQTSFDVPGSLLYTEIQHRSKQLFGSNSFKKKYETLSEDEKKEEFKKVETQAKDALKLFYICKKILTDNNIQITSKDINQEIETPLDAMFADRELANPNKTEEEKNLLMSRILLSKAQDFIIDKLAGGKSNF